MARAFIAMFPGHALAMGASLADAPVITVTTLVA